MPWQKLLLKRENGETIKAQAPEIISASRRTDVPAFYSQWFFHRLNKGYCAWLNPFSGQRNYVSFNNLRLIVFWSKNPRPLLAHLDTLKQKNIHTYIQFTLNDYEKEKLEPNLPPYRERLDTFKRLVDALGPGRVIWRFDPLLLTENLTMEELANRIAKIGKDLQGYTESLVFSFIEIEGYAKVRRNLKNFRPALREFTNDEKLSFAASLVKMNGQWNYKLANCCETLDFTSLGIRPNKCIDGELIYRLFGQDEVLKKFLGVKVTDLPLLGEKKIELTRQLKDTGQRAGCSCLKSKDIGEYETCTHDCLYCYATRSPQAAKGNKLAHQPSSETILTK